MERPLLRVTLTLGVLLSIACSGDKSHAPYRADDCEEPPCSRGVTVAGGGTPLGAGGATSSLPDASTTGTVQLKGCSADPNTNATLCAATSDCPSLQIDSSAFPGCGFLTTGRLDVACLCNLTQLCPVKLDSTCAALTTALSTQTIAEVCNQIGAGSCRDLSNAKLGTGGAASVCDPVCKSSCSGTPACLQFCGC